MEKTTSKNESTQLDSLEDNKPYGEEGKGTKRYERKAYEGTPFVIHHSEDHGYAAGIAEHRLTGWYESEETLKKVLKGYTPSRGIDWDLLTGVIVILIEKTNEMKKLNEKIEEANK